MMEVMKSKGMCLFMVVVLGIVYFDALNTKKMETDKIKDQNEMVVMNIR